MSREYNTTPRDGGAGAVETSFLVVFMSAVVKNVDSLMATSGRMIHLFSLLLAIHYFVDKKRREVSFKCSFSGMLSRACAKSSCQS